METGDGDPTACELQMITSTGKKFGDRFGGIDLWNIPCLGKENLKKDDTACNNRWVDFTMTQSPEVWFLVPFLWRFHRTYVCEKEHELEEVKLIHQRWRRKTNHLNTSVYLTTFGS